MSKIIKYSFVSFAIGIVLGCFVFKEWYSREALKAEVERNSQLAEMQKKLNESNLKLKEYENKYQKELAAVNSVAVSKLRVKANCSVPSNSGTSSGIAEGNSGTFILPDRVTEDLFAMTKKADELSARLRLCQEFVNEIKLKKDEIDRINANN